MLQKIAWDGLSRHFQALRDEDLNDCCFSNHVRNIMLEL